MIAPNEPRRLHRPRRRPRARQPASSTDRRLDAVTAAHDYDDLHHLVDRLTPRQAARLRLLVAADPELAGAAEQDEKRPRPPSIIGIWDSGRGDLSERHDEIIRERIKRTA